MRSAFTVCSSVASASYTREGSASGSCCSLREDIAQLSRNLAHDSAPPLLPRCSLSRRVLQQALLYPTWGSSTTNIRQERSPGVLLVELPPAPNVKLRWGGHH